MSTATENKINNKIVYILLKKNVDFWDIYIYIYADLCKLIWLVMKPSRDVRKKYRLY